MQQVLNAAAAVDLGPFDGPALIFGGPYGNLEATEALIEAAARRGVPARRALCTGDIVAYGADPQGVCDRLREWGCRIVMGNCEEALAAGALDCGCGFDEGSACAALSAQWFAASRRDLDAPTRLWMGGLPRRIDFTLGGRRIAAIHGGVARINRFVFASTPAHDKAAEIAAAAVDGIVAGHCGLPFSQAIDGRLWCNSGALGMPANDGTARAWFAILAPRADGVAIEHHALAYDHATTSRKMRERGYPAEYAESLTTGLWPSCDILPPEERAARGQPLAPPPLLWPSADLAVAAE